MAGKTGFNASLTVGGYTGAQLTNCSITVDHEPVEVSDLASTWKARAAGPRDWSLTGTKNMVTQAFVTLAASGATSVVVKVLAPNASTTLFSTLGYVTRGLLTLPMGAATEEITVVGKGSIPVVHA